MSLSMRAVCLLLGLVIAAPAAAGGGNQANRWPGTEAGSGAPTGYLKYCGARFVCYTGIPLSCASNTRPYQNVAERRCYCAHDGCPQ
jgi:hypothetical protein